MAINGIQAGLGAQAEPWVNQVEAQLVAALREIKRLQGLVSSLSTGR